MVCVSRPKIRTGLDSTFRVLKPQDEVQPVVLTKFVGFNSWSFSMISIEFSRLRKFQGLLDAVFNMLNHEVKQMSYARGELSRAVFIK